MKTLILRLNKLTLREEIIIFLFENSKNLYRNVFKNETEAWKITVSDLLKYPNNSLGKDLAIFLKTNDFKLEPKLEKHDIYHILSDYPTTVIGEICLSSFNIGTGKRSLYTMIVAIIGAVIMLDKYKLFLTAYKRGKKAKSYTKWNFEYLLKEETDCLKKLLFNQKNLEKGII